MLLLFIFLCYNAMITICANMLPAFEIFCTKASCNITTVSFTSFIGSFVQFFVAS